MATDVLERRIMINGPINVVRVEGIIMGVRKIAYFFMDEHIEVENQTACKNIFAENIQSFLARNFDALSQKENQPMIDFFIEVSPTEIGDYLANRSSMSNNLERYIDEVSKFFVRSFNYNQRTNRVLVNSVFSKIRLHFLDARDYFVTIMYDRTYQLNDTVADMAKGQYISVKKIKRVITLLTEIYQHVDLVKTCFTADFDKPPKKILIKKASRYVETDILKYLAYKIRFVYHHKLVQKNMQVLIDRSVQNMQNILDYSSEMLKDFQRYVNEIVETRGMIVTYPESPRGISHGLPATRRRYILTDIENRCDFLVTEYFTEYFARLTDIYFLRRYLDKDYITHAVVYTGAYHSVEYIDVLIRMFDFKVTHVAYSRYDSIERINQEIKSGTSGDSSLIFEAEQQCSDITHFPKDFL